MNKLSLVLLVGLSAVVGVLSYQNLQLKKQVNELTVEIEKLKVEPFVPPTRATNPEGASPFDKPNVDPLADRFANPEAGVTTIKFEKMEHDFGRINEGDVVKTQFKFTNTGKAALLITHAQGSCGCTVPQWPEERIKPGESGVINVQFDSHAKVGEVTKTVAVSANTSPPTTTLIIKATIVPRDK
jgi:hypothetical protein